MSIIKAEIRQIPHKKWVWWTIVSILLIEILSAFVYHKTADIQDSPLPSAFEMLGFTLRGGVYVTIFFLLAATAMSISREESSGVLKTILSKLVSRWEYPLGKLIVIVITGFGLILFSSMVSMSIGGMYGDYESLKEGTYIIISTNQLWKSLSLVILLIIPAMIASLCMGLFFSVISRNSGLAVVLTFGFLIGLSLMAFSDFSVVFDIENKLLTHYLSFPLDTFFDLTKGLPVTWTPKVWGVIGGSIIYIGLFCSMTIVFFLKRDFS